MIKLDKAMLVLGDGTEFSGWAFGARGEAMGEVVFHTGMTGYQEILTDPSYCGQIVTMTYPEIGNTGINMEDMESDRVWVEGFVVKECIDLPSNYRAEKSLHTYLEEQGIPGIQGIDTRFLTRHIRTHGAQAGIISTEDLDPKSLLDKVRSAPGIVGRDMVEFVTCKEPYEFYEGLWHWDEGHRKPGPQRFRVVAVDYGIKTNILRNMAERGMHVTVVPADASAEEILEHNPDGLFLSNGPGDPAGLPYAAEAVRKVAQQRPELPIMGICLGHQIIGRAFGAETIKLKFGHHGANHPVLDMETGEIAITSQNHGFAVPEEFFNNKVGQEFIFTHRNLNDQTVEGMRHRERPIFSVQYHPEASPGPHDASSLFDRFREALLRVRDLMEEA